MVTTSPHSRAQRRHMFAYYSVWGWGRKLKWIRHNRFKENSEHRGKRSVLLGVKDRARLELEQTGRLTCPRQQFLCSLLATTQNEFLEKLKTLVLCKIYWFLTVLSVSWNFIKILWPTTFRLRKISTKWIWLMDQQFLRSSSFPSFVSCDSNKRLLKFPDNVDSTFIY